MLGGAHQGASRSTNSVWRYAVRHSQLGSSRVPVWTWQKDSCKEEGCCETFVGSKLCLLCFWCCTRIVLFCVGWLLHCRLQQSLYARQRLILGNTTTLIVWTHCCFVTVRVSMACLCLRSAGPGIQILQYSIIIIIIISLHLVPPGSKNLVG